MGSELQGLSDEMRAAVEQEMRTVLRADEPLPDSMFGMLQYHMGWLDAEMRPTALNSGKQIRPVLCLLCCMASDGEWMQAIPAAAAIELLHNFSLIHDDIEDASPTRRGRQTLWSIWGIEQAINAGDAMFALAHLAMNRLVDRGVKSETAIQALRRFDETCVRLTQGQHADMVFERRSQVSVEEYVEMVTGKTAVLISLCAELGALIAGTDARSIFHYASFGRDLGLAFQVKDDILGIWGNESVTGKSAATDVVTKKKTLPVLHGLSKSETLRRLYAQEESGEEFVEAVILSLDQLGSRQYAIDEAARYSESAREHLRLAEPSEPAALALMALVDMLLKRDY